MGVNSTRIVQLTFLIGGLMAGAAATLYMIRIGATRFDAGFILGVKAFTAAVMGGIGNLRGALLGGLILGVAENWGSALIGTQWKDVVAFCLLVLILLFRPTGLLGRVARERRGHEHRGAAMSGPPSVGAGRFAGGSTACRSRSRSL